MTEVSAMLLLRTKANDAGQYWKILRKFYDRTTGLGMHIVRVPVGPNDFAVEGMFYDGTAQNDFSLKTGKRLDASRMAITPFSRANVLPVLKDILTINPEIILYLESWALPWWMMQGKY
ncbi:uncharacterized protein EV422DRAFT_570939 [Fimicolochytrium jonesii]|uniref:uncharacterized protein n=1 Tax=Fimicolochytrium jonesii TaxID=1396493 RepID=UPI0022FED425|nr:uncharacterized protein EV422DRAFT_570939 [Fimicolochytrium jonesii]KAI8817324.1 hypothetical protein EV422DRAFT_570939 [Fimicolochytrium jonesii]